jgi:hypothetical protein
MIILDATTDTIKAVLGGTVTTNQLQCVAAWRDITTSAYTPGKTVINTNNTTDVTVVGSPAASTQRVVDYLSIHNKDTVSQTVTIKFDANGTQYILWKGTIAADKKIEYQDGIGFHDPFATAGGGAADGYNILAAGTQTANTTGTVNFANSNGISFGMSNSSQITASYTVPSTAGLVSAVNISAGTTNSNLSNFSFKDTNGISFGLSAGSIISASVATSLTNVNVSAGTTSNNLSAMVFSNSNNVSFGLNGSTVTATITVPSQTNQTVGLYASSNTTLTSSGTADARSLSFRGIGGVTVGYSANELLLSGVTTGGLVSAVNISAGTTNSNLSNFSFKDTNGVSFGLSAGSIISASVATSLTAVKISAGTASANLSALTFFDSNNVSFGFNASTVTATASFPAQTNQTIGIYGSSNTTLTSSGTIDARSLSIRGVGIISVGYSSNEIVLSVPSGGGGDGFNQAGFTNSTANSNMSLVWAGNSNGSGNLTFGLTGSTITGSAALSGIGAGVSNLGNTAGSTGTVTTGNVVFVGSNGITLSQSTGAAGSNATITIMRNPPTSYFEPPMRGQTLTGTQANGTVYVQPFWLEEAHTMYRMQILQSVSTQSATTCSLSYSFSSQTSSNANNTWGQSGTVLLYSRVSTGTNASSSQLVSFFSASYSHSVGISHSITWSTNASSATASFTSTGQVQYNSSIDSVGGLTTSSFSTSGSGSTSSTSTNQNSSSWSHINSFLSSVMSGLRPILIPFATSLTPGEYWLAHIQSSASGTTNYNHSRVVSIQPQLICYSTVTANIAEIGGTATLASSNIIQGWGSYSASSNTSAASGIPHTAISPNSQLQTWFNMMAWVK